MKKSLNAVWLFFLGVFLSLLLLEGGMRMAQRAGWIKNYQKYCSTLSRSTPEIYEPDAYLLHKLRANGEREIVTADYHVRYKINPLGLRDRERKILPKKNFRLLALGDSFTFGVGVELHERFTEIAENSLPGVEIWNAGVPGWGLDQELIYFLREGYKWNPDSIIIFLNQADLERQLEGFVSDGQVQNPQAQPVYISSSTILQKPSSLQQIERSVFLSFLYYVWTIESWKWKNQSYKTQERSIEKSSARAAQTEERTKILLKQFDRLAKKHRAKLIVVNIDPVESFSYIKTIEPKILYVDFSQKLNEESRHFPLRFPHDPHFNARTHRWIGLELAKVLQDLLK